MVDAESRGVFASIIPRTHLDVRINAQVQLAAPCLVVVAGASGKIQNLQSHGFHLDSRRPLGIVLADFLTLVFSGSTTVGMPLKATAFDAL
jgi:hypothetical protein